MRTERRGGDLEQSSAQEKVREPLAPRVIILDKAGNLPLVEYKKTGWFGLPGGKVEEDELTEGVDYLSSGSFPTLIREIKEETEIDVSGFIHDSACLGIAEIGVVDSVEKRIDFNISPIFVCRMDTIEGASKKTKIANLNSHLPGPIFPDARLAIGRLKEGLRDEKGPIEPKWLNEEGVFYFELRPKMRLLFGPPSWMSKGVQS